MYSEITSTLLSHALFGAVLAIFALAMAFWLFLAFRSARAMARKLASLDWAVQASPKQESEPVPQLKARVS
jgi:hypothetical protein